MGNIKIGWGEETFVFNKPVSLTGQFAERISEYTEKPLTATALAIEANGEQLVMCALDLVGASIHLLSVVRDKLKDNKLGLDVSKIVLSAIHTHTGPTYTGGTARAFNQGLTSTFRDLIESQLPEGKRYVEKEDVSSNDAIMNEDELLSEISEKTAKAILKAWESRKAGGYANEFGRAAVGMCRRACYSDGSSQMWGDTNRAVFTQLEGGNDSGIELLYFFDESKKLTGVAVNLACPAQCVQHRLFISPDFWGEVKMLLRKKYGDDIFMLPLCSPAGDQCPVDLIRWVEPESDVNDPNLKRYNPPYRKADPSMFDLSGMRKAGKRISNEIFDAYDEALSEIKYDSELYHEVKTVRLPLRRATLAEEAEAKRRIAEYLDKKTGDTVDYNDAANLQVHIGILRRMELQEKVDTFPIEMHVVRLGNIAIATNPFELFLDYGNQIKARSAAEQTFLVQLANGYEGYLPTEKAEKGGHYSAFISSGGAGHEGGDILVRETLSEIKRLFTLK